MINKDNYLILGDFIWEVESKELKKVDSDADSDDSVVLTPKQYQLLKCLYDAHPNVLKKEEIVEKVWGSTFTSPESLPQLIIRTRNAIGDSTKKILVNRPGVGYSLSFQSTDKGETNAELAKSEHSESVNQKSSFGCWQLLLILMCLITAYNAFEVGKSFYYGAVFKQVHQTNPYPNILNITDGKVDLLIGKTKCVYEKKKLLLQCL